MSLSTSRASRPLPLLVIISTKRLVYPRAVLRLDRRMSGRQNRSGPCGEEKNYALQGIEPGPLRNYLTVIPIKLSRPVKEQENKAKFVYHF
jgi:hypothetical protein